MSYNDFFQIDATLIANEFLDNYMPKANGDYVKVYLYLLKHHVNGIDVETVAESLELTEGDVRRAIRYWEQQGILSIGSEPEKADGCQRENPGHIASQEIIDDTASAVKSEPEPSRGGTVSTQTETAEHAEDPDPAGGIRSRYRRTEGRTALERLSSDDEFRELLFIVQKYRSKILTESEEQVFAYLYDGLHIPCDVLDYLVQYCVENKHNNIRYIEKTGLDWASHGIITVEAARNRTRQFEAAAQSGKPRTARAGRPAAGDGNKKGITREKDLDKWLSEVVTKNVERNAQ